ncbi:MAG TPA: hypothetical protein PLX97_03095 [Gemmatales bacterium]|nr:hypothetical protein [Gemmatales bacterium]
MCSFLFSAIGFLAIPSLVLLFNMNQGPSHGAIIVFPPIALLIIPPFSLIAWGLSLVLGYLGYKIGARQDRLVTEYRARQQQQAN